MRPSATLCRNEPFNNLFHTHSIDKLCTYLFLPHFLLAFIPELCQRSYRTIANNGWIFDGLWIFEAFARLWLICSTADAVRKAVIIKLVNIYKTLINNQLFPSLQVGGLHQHFAIPSMFNNLHSTTI